MGMSPASACADVRRRAPSPPQRSAPPSDSHGRRSPAASISPRTKSPSALRARSTGGGGPSSRPCTSRSQSDWPRSPLRLADQHDHVALGLERRSSPSCANRRAGRRRRPPGSAGWRCRRRRRLGLVVEADVAAHDREVERAAGLGHAFDAADDLAHDLGPLRVAEVQVVGDGERAWRRRRRGCARPRRPPACRPR